MELTLSTGAAHNSSMPGSMEKAADTIQATSSSRNRCGGLLTQNVAEAGVQCSSPSMAALEKEKAELKQRLEFVEELLGPTETQRKDLQEQVVAARAAALRAKQRGAGLPTKVAGRLNENLLWSCGLSERDAGLLQGGCLPNKEGILQDVSLLGDPGFRPYDEHSGELRWHARGGMLQLSLGEVRDRYGDDVVHDVVRCAKELDKWDPSRRVGIELPWHPLEDRELTPAEVIDFMDQELSLQSSMLYSDERDAVSLGHMDPQDSYVSPCLENYPSPYAVVNSQPRRGRVRRSRGSRQNPTGTRAASSGIGPSRGAAAAQGGSAVVALPRVGPELGRRGPPDARCALPSHLRHRMQEALDQSLLGCYEGF